MIEDLALDVATVLVGGVGYEVYCTRACAAGLSVGTESYIQVYTDVKEDSIRLYGFSDKTERQVFLLLMKVTGVGAKSGLDILSRIDKLDLLRIIGAADTTRLQQVKGIGKKTAERIVVELKDKVSEFVDSSTAGRLDERQALSEPLQDAIAALVALGFSRRDAEKAIARVGDRVKDDMTAGEVVREALKFV